MKIALHVLLRIKELLVQIMDEGHMDGHSKIILHIILGYLNDVLLEDENVDTKKKS